MSPIGDAPDAGDASDADAQDASDPSEGGDASDGDGPDAEAGGAEPGGTGTDAAPRRRRRRRRRRGEAAAAEGESSERTAAPPAGRSHGPHAPVHVAPARGEPRRDARARDPERSSGSSERPSGGPERPSGGSERPPGGSERPSGGSERGRGDADRRQRAGRTGEPARGRGNRDERSAGPGRPSSEDRREPGGDRNRDALLRSDPPPPGSRAADVDSPSERYALQSSSLEGPTLRLDPRRPVAPAEDLEIEGPTAPAIPWGNDDDGPPPDVTLEPDLPADAPADDPDPLTYPLVEAPSAALGDDVASIAGVRFVAAGRVQWCDAGEADYAQGERVLVDTERGPRLAWIAVAPSRRTVRDRGLRRVIRRANDQDLRGERAGDVDRAHALRIAKDKAAALRLPLKVFRVELLGQLGRGARINVYYTSDERIDLRDFIRDLSTAAGGARIELRQLGVRDEAKAVGGIGSCGLTLCCTTWLPDFVPVSIKMAKDQGLVLSPTKVSGQCGRLKCCLVYEQAGYAELRKGLPKLGKRVIGARGEGRVVEVDVLRQRIRVSYGPGDTEVVAASEVRPMFPSGNQPRAREVEPEDVAGEATDDGIDETLGDAVGESDGAIDLPDGLDDPAPPDDDPSTAT